MPKLTEGNLTLTDAIRAKPKGSVYYIWDREIRGFGLRINVTGAKVFVMKYRNPEGKQAWLTLHEFDYRKSSNDKTKESLAQVQAKESLDKAKAKAREYRDLIKEKSDPKAGILKALEIPTFAKFAADWLLVKKSEVSTSYYDSAKYFLEKISIPQIGGLRMTQVEQRHVSELLEGYGIGKRPWLKDGELEDPVVANYNRFRGVLNSLFKKAESAGIRPRFSNPCLYIEKKKENPPRKRYLTAEELSWLGKVMSEAHKWEDREACPYAFNEEGEHLVVPSVYAVEALRLLMLTGCRKSEILKLRWQGVLKGRKILSIEDHKTRDAVGTKELPLTPAVLSVLEGLEKLPTRILGGEWVIQGRIIGSPMVNIDKPWHEIQKAVKLASKGTVNVDDVNIHILRHSFASVGVSDGVNLFMVGGLLGHSSSTTTQRYAHLATDPKMQASTQISDKIAGLLGS